MSAYSSYDDVNAIPAVPELDVDETVHLVRSEVKASKYDAAALIDLQLSNVKWEGNAEGTVEENLFIIFEGLSRDLALVANEVENEIIALQRQVKRADASMLNDLETHLEKLGEVRSAVDNVKVNFDRASEGAVRIGERLATSENERRRIEMAMELLNHIAWFEKTPTAQFSELQNKTSEELRQALPASLQKKDWGVVSQVLCDLKRVLYDINASDVQNAQKNVVRLADAVEEKLLAEFDASVTDLMDNPSSATLIGICKDLIVYLHMYNNGQSLHKHFIACVVEKSIPRSAFVEEKAAATSSSAWSKLTQGVSSVTQGVRSLGNIIKRGDAGGGVGDDGGEGGDDGGDDGGNGSGDDSLDSLSQLFGSIGSICQQQFSLIRDIFPRHVVAKITRILIQKIFTDPAFGIQARVDAVLSPKPPWPALPLPEFLESLANVREKLAALFVILLEYCSHPAMAGMGNEAALSRAVAVASASASTSGGPSSISALTNAASASDALLDELNEKAKSDREVREFLQEQILGVLSSYLGDYFDKEMQHVRNQYVEGLRRVVDDDKGPSKVVAGSVMQKPRFRADKMKSIPSLVKTVANNYYVSNVVSTTTDSVMRMENICRDDKKLPARIKELYLLQLGFLIDGVFFPYVQACTTMLLRSAVSAPKNSVLPPLEYIQALAAVYAGVALLKKNFTDVFLHSMQDLPNLVQVCKDARRNALKPLEHAAKESMHSWTMCVILHMERTLAATQAPSDYNPGRNDERSAGGGAAYTEPSAACDSVCQSFMKVVSTVQGYKADLVGIDLVETFWRPLGQQFVGTLLSFLRKQKISPEGAPQLMADLDEYYSIAASMEVPDTTDMLLCLKEMAAIFAAPPEHVTKIVVENLRHLDTIVVLALLRARADFTTRGGSNFWTRKVSTAYGFSKWDHMLQWEKRKVVSVMSVIETAANTDPLGPVTLRKASISTLEMELIHSQHLGATSDDEGEEGEDGAAGGGGGSGSGDGRQTPAITGPASFAAAIQERFAALLPQMDKPKMFGGASSGSDLRFNFGLGGGDDNGDGGPRVTEVIAGQVAQGFEDIGEGMRNAGEKITSAFSEAGGKITGGFRNGVAAVKNTLKRSGNSGHGDEGSLPNSGYNSADGEQDGDEDGVAESKEKNRAEKPKMVNPFLAIKAAGGAVGGAIGRATSPLRAGIERAVSPLRGKGGGEASGDDGEHHKDAPPKGKMLMRLSSAFGGSK